MSATPLPCPFCGTVGLVFNEGSTFRWRIANCINCDASAGEERIQTTGSGTHEEWEANCRSRLIEAWNRRVPAIDTLPERVESLKPSLLDAANDATQSVGPEGVRAFFAGYVDGEPPPHPGTSCRARNPDGMCGCPWDECAMGATGALAHSKSEYKRRVAMDDPLTRHMRLSEEIGGLYDDDASGVEVAK